MSITLPNSKYKEGRQIYVHDDLSKWCSASSRINDQKQFFLKDNFVVTLNFQLVKELSEAKSVYLHGRMKF